MRVHHSLASCSIAAVARITENDLLLHNLKHRNTQRRAPPAAHTVQMAGNAVQMPHAAHPKPLCACSGRQHRHGPACDR